MTDDRSATMTPGPSVDPTALAPGSHGVLIDGLEQRYHVAGRGPVCLVHSGGPGVGWDYLRMPAVERHLTLVYVEPIGTGDSGRLDDPRGYTLDRYARHVDGLIDHLGIDRAYLLGHSYGGFVALRYALRHPERLTGLILYDTSPTTTDDFMADVGENFARLPERHAGAPWLPDAMAAWGEEPAASADPSTTDEEITRILRRGLRVYFADYSGREREFAPVLDGLRVFMAPSRGEEPAPYDVRDQLASITVPTLVLVGRHDPICSVRWATALHDGIPGSALTIFEQSGHMAHIEEPDTFAAAIREWVWVDGNEGNDVLGDGVRI